MNKKEELTGSRLKKARIKKGLSLQDIYAKIKIHPRILEALEEDKAQETLSRVYIKSFLKRYADFLGVKKEDVVAEKSADETVSQAVPHEVQIEKDTTPFFVKFKKYLLPLAAGLVIALLAYVFFVASVKMMFGFKNFVKDTRAKVQTAKKTDVPKKEARGFKVIPENEELVLSVKTAKDVWLEVKSDGNTVFRHVLPQGSHETWKANDKIELWLGKAEYVELALNSRILGSPGKGVIKNVVLTREGMKVGK